MECDVEPVEFNLVRPYTYAHVALFSHNTNYGQSWLNPNELFSELGRSGGRKNRITINGNLYCIKVALVFWKMENNPIFPKYF